MFGDPTPQPPSRLRLFQPDEAPSTENREHSPGNLSPRMSLSEFYEAWIFPLRRVEARRPKTELEDRQSLSYWVRFTGDPPLEQIDRQTCLDFVAALKTLPGRNGDPISPNTIRKHCRQIQFILDMAGPSNRRERDTANLLERTPYLKRPPERTKEAIDNFSLDEISAILDACPEAKAVKNTRPIPTGTYFRALMLFEYNTGLRIETAMELHWTMIHEDKRGWWAIVPAGIFKGRRHGGTFYLNRWAIQAIHSIRLPGEPRVFPWEHWPKSEQWLHTIRRRIMLAAGINRPGVGFHGLRKTLITWLAIRNPMVASMVAGHRSGNVTRDHYVDPRIVADLLDQLPQPGRSIQKTLF